MNTKANSRFSCTLRIFIQIILFELSSNMILPNSATQRMQKLWIMQQKVKITVNHY